ncbi:hypothetical protein KSP39_PZI012183 [Platanthera zijinensis]|uniref:Uncharacterized protein n=1 Tax=Platanthera zijinensis TaxID=2320716 RepID=A0AAP0BG33_9ASPA
MTCRPRFRGGGSVGYINGDAKLADYISMSHYQANESALKPRRSSRLKGITAIYEQSCLFENSLHESIHSPPMQNQNAIADSDGTSTIDITLKDLLTRCKNRKRGASSAQSSVDLQEHNIAIMKSEEQSELEETLFSLKTRKRKSSPSTSEKLSNFAEPGSRSSPTETIPVHAFSLISEGGLGEASLNETNVGEFLAASEVGLMHEIESLNGKMSGFPSQSSVALGSPKSAFEINEIIETYLDKSENGESTMDSSSPCINKCDFDNNSLCEGLDNVSQGEDCGKPGSDMSSTMEPITRVIIEQSRLEFEGTAPSVCSIENFKHNSNLPAKVLERDGQHGFQFEVLLPFDKEVIESNCEMLTCSMEDDIWYAENMKQYKKVIASLTPEIKISSCYDDIGGAMDDSGVSLSIENHENFADEVKNSYMYKNNCLESINGHTNLNTGRDEENNMVYGDCSEQVSEYMQPASIYTPNSISQMTLVDASCAIVHAGSPYVNTSEDREQDSHNGDSDSDCSFSTAYYPLDADKWALQPDNLPPSQLFMLDKCLESQPCRTNVSDLPDETKLSGETICRFSESQLNVKDGISKSTFFLDTIVDLPGSSFLKSSAKICAERKITNTLKEERQTINTQFGGNQCAEIDHPTKKLLSNRKEISPNSQEKLLRALNNGSLDDVVKLSNSMQKLCFDKGAAKCPLSSFLSNRETFVEERMFKKPKVVNQSFPEVTKGILKSPPNSTCSNPCCSKNSSIHARTHDAILFSQRQMQDTENITTKLLHGLSSLKSIVEETLFSGPSSFPSDVTLDEIRLAAKHASKLEATTKKWLAMMTKDCNRFCKIMRLEENKSASPVSDLHKGRKKITFADEAGGTLCHFKVYEQQPVAFIVPKI